MSNLPEKSALLNSDITAPGSEHNTSSPGLTISSSRQFTSWLKDQGISIAFTTYQAGKVFFIGLQTNGQLSFFERTLDRCMGMYVCGSSLYLSSLYQLWRFENVLEPGEEYNGYDALYVPQVAYVTGDVDVHDIAMADAPLREKQSSSRLVFVNTLFSCLATVSETHSFVPLWQPPFISKLAAEDRCHLNGLAMRDGKPAYVTAVSQSDVAEGWRDRRQNGGCIIDVTSREVIVKGLSMPHSPRWYRDRLWGLNSGCGEFGSVDLATGKFEPLTFCPGYLRGLAFYGNFAVVGLSKPRHNRTFSGLPLDQRLQDKEAEPRCGLMVIDLRTGDAVHSLRIDGVVAELYDVQIFTGMQRPMAIGFKTDEIRRVITVGE